jgi:orotidine-5'-phosphate decarboxylase
MNRPTAAAARGPRVIVALDYADAAPALDLVGRLSPGLCRLKVGKELFTRTGPELVRQLIGRGFEVFLDLKFHDIPNTVAAACAAAVDLGVWMVNVHGSGGARMMAAAREAVGEGADRPLLIAVTVLTSLDAADLAAIGCPGEPAERVIRLARLAADQGLDGVVCSAREAPAVRAACGAGFRLVTPGVRPAGSGSDDQKRVLTPAEAIAAGADYLVIGRPVTRAQDPIAVLEAIAREVAAPA